MAKAMVADFFSLTSGEKQLEEARIRISELEELNRQFATQLESNSEQAPSLPIDLIDRNAEQVRRYFDPIEQEKLTESMRLHGFWGRLLVRRNGQRYELIAGERRLRSAIAAQLTHVKADILDVDDNEALSLSLIENLNRVDLNPVEETEGILRLLASRLGCDLEATKAMLYKMKNHSERSNEVSAADAERFAVIEYVFNTVGRVNWQTFMSSRIRLLKLPIEILDFLKQGKIEYSKAIEISRLKNQDDREVLLQQVIDDNLSVAEIREWVKELRPEKTPTQREKLKDLLKIFPKSFSDSRKAKQAEKLIEKLQKLLIEG